MNLIYKPSFIGFLSHARSAIASHISCTFAAIISVASFCSASFTKILSLQNSKCKYSPMPPEFQFKEPPLALGTPVQRIPPSLRIPKSCLSWCIDIFWNCPISMLYYSSMNIVTHPAFGNSKMLYPAALPPKYFFFFRPLESLCDCLKLVTKGKLARFLCP